MKFTSIIAWWIFCVAGVHSFLLIPEELPSILSIFYSNVPPVKKGTDSRIGIGFRLGPNADFQVQFEIGPQLNTQPIGPNASNSSSGTSGSAAKKRQTRPSTAGSSKLSAPTFNSSNPGEAWLNVWKTNVDEYKVSDTVSDDHKTAALDTNTIKHIGDPTKEKTSFVSQLRQLYRHSSMSNKTIDTGENEIDHRASKIIT